MDRRQLFAILAQLFRCGPHAGGDDLPDEVRLRWFEAEGLDGTKLRQVNGVVQPVLDIAVETGHEAVPQATLGENQEAQAVDAVHELDNAGEERLADFVSILGTADEEQVLEL